ncbi:MAG TPA: PEPxxWA-CTERM sorting domain-containing protein [Sphingomonas sp.]|uniref:PEPxxWA-CTERM sorting domain-containing protein n=1 Tax=Sphingomonas sp. TaxID=28214 RepID=UPI002C0FD8DD|nr:PEPxxWA-CTERM sorting domain-containing protein [Sphingomonas sp.]HMI19116.1 PEPxxWA-CTERM sorting domain-containing protein [Sphingomonas sp.]
MNIKRLTIAALFAAAAVAPAQAANFLFQYDADQSLSQVGSPLSATLYLTTSDVLNSIGGYDILSASGTVDGSAVTGLVVNPNQPNLGLVASFFFDNVLYTSGPGLSEAGFVVSTSALTINFGYSGGYYAISADGSTHVNTHGQTVFNTKFSTGDGSLSAVPESASWAMMVAGFGMAGAAMRRRRPTVRFA